MLELKEYLNEIPEEIKNAVRAIDDETRLAILMILMREGELTFSQLLEKLRLNSSTLSHHLKVLVQAALIENYYAKKPDIHEYSFYNITTFGEEFVRGLCHTVDITPRIQDALSLALAPTYPKLNRHKSYYSSGLQEVLLLQPVEMTLSAVLQYRITLQSPLLRVKELEELGISGQDIEFEGAVPLLRSIRKEKELLR